MFDDQKNPVGIFCLGYNITKYVAEELQRYATLRWLEVSNRSVFGLTKT